MNEHIPASVIKSLNTILDYLEDSEADNYEEYVSERNDPKNHVYHHVLTVREWINKRN